MNPLEERFPRLWAFGEKVSVLIIGSLMFYLFGALIITIPAALVGLLATVAALVRPVPGEPIFRFWRGLLRTFGRATLLGLIDLALGLILYLDFRFFWAMGGTGPRIAAYAFGAAGIVLAMANVYAWPLLAWYPQPLGKLIRRSLLLAAAHPFYALLGLLGAAVVVLIFLLLPGGVKALPVLLGPGLIGLAIGGAAWLAMKRYAGPDDDFAE